MKRTSDHVALQLRAGGLALPLVAFIFLSFVAPLGNLLTRSVYEPVVADALPETLRALEGEWRGGLPPDAAFDAIARELPAARETRQIGPTATRVNRRESGMRSVIVKTARRVARFESRAAAGEPWRRLLPEIDAAWERPESWRAIRAAGERFTDRHYLNALDLDRDADGDVVRQPPERRIYISLFLRTLVVSLGVTLLCLLIGYPLAHLITNASAGMSRMLLLLVLVPFWTSLLVRTTAWIVLLQQQGAVNDLLVWIGLVPDDARLSMIYNMTGTFVAMTHVLLPFMVLPLYSVMRSIPKVHMAAAASLGASPIQAFRRVYWPQSLPGVAAGSLLVFILSIGYYITPALVGGQSGQLISNMIAHHMQTSLNWALAAALGGVLLLAVLALYLVYDRLVGIDKLRLG